MASFTTLLNRPVPSPTPVTPPQAEVAPLPSSPPASSHPTIVIFTRPTPSVPERTLPDISDAIKSFIKKWDGRTLEDWGCSVSKEFRSFQTAFINIMKKIAAKYGGELVNCIKGHYDICGFFKIDGKFVYWNYDNGLSRFGRSHIDLGKSTSFLSPMYMRTAKNEKDYRGGSNNHVLFTECEKTISRLLSE